MLAVKDADFVVRGNAYQFAMRFKMTEKEVLEGLKILSSPDKKRLEKQPYDGRRIERVSDGWLILNADKYRAMVKKYKKENRNEYMREYMKKRRKRSPTLAEKNYVKQYENGEVD